MLRPLSTTEFPVRDPYGPSNAAGCHPPMTERLLPFADGELYSALENILSERSPQLLFPDLLEFAKELIRERRSPLLVQQVLEAAREYPATSIEAERLITLKRGGGAFPQQLEHRMGPLLEELTDPLFLLPFGVAVGAGRLASLGVLSRAPQWTTGTLLASEAVALGAEVPALVFSRRLGQQIFAGGENIWAPDSVFHELALTVGPLAMFRLGGGMFRWAAPNLQKVSWFQNSSGQINGLGHAAMESARLGTEVSAVLGGHYLNGAAGLEILPHDGSQLLASSLLTVAQLRIAGKLIEAWSPGGLTQALNAEKLRLHQNSRELPRPPWDFGIGLGSDLVPIAAGNRGVLGRASVPRPLNETVVQMSAENGNPAGSGKSPSEPPSSDTLIKQELGRRITSLEQSAANDTSSSILQTAVRRLNILWNRYSRNPQEASQEELAGELREVEDSLYTAKGKGEGIQNHVRAFRLWLEQVRSQRKSSEPRSDSLPLEGKQEILPPEESGGLRQQLLKAFGRGAVFVRDAIKERIGLRRTIQEEVKAKGKATATEDGLNLEAIVEELQRKEGQGEEFNRALRVAIALRKHLFFASQSEKLSPAWQGRLNQLVDQLENYFPNMDWSRVGLSETTANEVQVARDGAVLGLAVKPHWVKTDSPLAKMLRGDSLSGMDIDNRPLELLHQSILLAAHFEGSPREFKQAMNGLAFDYRVEGSAAEAMGLMGESVFRLVRRRQTRENLLSFLESRSTPSGLEVPLKSLSGYLGSDLGFDLIMERLASEPTTEQYFLSGLYLFLRAGPETAKVRQLMEDVGQARLPGFNPTITASLFGAAQGREAFPTQWIAPNLRIKAFLERAKSQSQDPEI